VRGNRPGELTDVPRIPEPFLWHVVESLAIAGLLLERGVVDGNPMRNWETIVHRDLRPANIFFGDPDPERFNRYPTPKIGDWGSGWPPTNLGLHVWIVWLCSTSQTMPLFIT
jgi:serine/threonine protein kinase